MALIFTALSKAIDQNRGPKIGALIAGAGFIRGNTIDTEDARKALAEHGGVIQPIPNVSSITITEADLSSTPAQIAIKVFAPITQSIYDNGIDATAQKYAPGAEQAQKFKKDASMLGVLSKKTHKTFSKISTILLTISLILAAGVVYFSSRWGRLANLGLLLVFISLPLTLLSMALTHAQPSDPAQTGSVATAIQTEIGHTISETYSKYALLGLLLLLVALIGRIVSAFLKPKDKHSEKPA